MAGNSLRDALRKAQGIVATADLPVTDENKEHPPYVLPRHYEWMKRPEERRLWTPEAIEFSTLVHRGHFKHRRDRRISPSSLGDDCERLVLLGFGDHPKLPFPIANAEKMTVGEFHHLRWQREGISAGYMTPAPGDDWAGELWLHSEALRCGGSADARLDDASLFELKSTGSHLYKGIVTGRGSASNYAAGMHRKHKLQMEAYWLVDEIGAAERGEPRKLSDWGSLVYQDSGDPSNIHEFRIHSSPSRRAEVNRILEGLHDWIDLDQLPDMLDGCAKSVTLDPSDMPTEKEMTVFNRCPQRESCPKATAVMRK